MSAKREICCPSVGKNLSAYQEYLLSAVNVSLRWNRSCPQAVSRRDLRSATTESPTSRPADAATSRSKSSRSSGATTRRPSSPFLSSNQRPSRSAVRLLPSPKACALVTRYMRMPAAVTTSSTWAIASSAFRRRSTSSDSSNHSSSWRTARLIATANSTVGRINGREGTEGLLGTPQDAPPARRDPLDSAGPAPPRGRPDRPDSWTSGYRSEAATSATSPSWQRRQGPRRGEGSRPPRRRARPSAGTRWWRCGAARRREMGVRRGHPSRPARSWSGGERIRTADFYVANVALCQLSYTPGATDQRSRRFRAAVARLPPATGVASP